MPERTPGSSREVARNALGVFEELAQARAKHGQALTARLRALGQQGGSWISWDDLVGVVDEIGALTRDGESIADMGAAVIQSRDMGWQVRIMGAMTTPRSLYRLVFRWAGPRTFRHIDVDYSEHRDGTIEVRLSLPESYRGCADFFRFTAGTARAASQMLGLPAAEVEADIGSHYGAYRIRPPSRPSLLLRAWKYLAAWFSHPYIVKELTSQQEALVAQHGQLQDALAVAQRERDAAAEARDRAEAALKIGRRFLANANHELRTPLQALSASLALLEESVNAAGRQELDSARVAAGALQRLVESILELTEVDATDTMAVERLEATMRSVNSASGIPLAASDVEAVAEPAGPPARLLLCEDNVVNRMLLSKQLEQLGYDVTAVEDGRAGVDAVRKTRFDAILMDCDMPVLDGFDATRQIRALEGCEDLPIFAVTAYVTREERRRCFECGMNAFLPKPLSVDGLRSALHGVGPQARSAAA